MIVAQAGRLEYEAILFLASLRHCSPGWTGRVIVAEPQPDGAWSGHDTRIHDDSRALLVDMGAEIVPFTARHFGASYPNGNKIEALGILPPGEPFVFFDTDTLITGPLDRVPMDPNRPAASMRRTATWPRIPLYQLGYADIWRSLYDRFGLDFDSSLDTAYPEHNWQRYLYFNAGWFFGADPVEFGRRFTDWAVTLRNDPHSEMAAQVMDPWLDQIILPLVIHSFGGGRPGPELAGLDGDVTCHYRKLPLLYARESDGVVDLLETITARNAIKRRLREWEPAKMLIYQGKGRDKVRPIFAGQPIPTVERVIRRDIKRAGWWLV
ncbi:MAG: hypothetical protein Q4G20_11470 [Paracoccus sp. (in: a-proteobacteria)]|nr:hypothetical protein [Paracoccus sp. (in: a-proteobacteria)]MDO5648541.1 hypothetical protein [Paracoccus sp. (in: a-proteobacteria)]